MKMKLHLVLFKISLLCLSLAKLEAAQFLIDFGVAGSSTNVDVNGNQWNNLTTVNSTNDPGVSVNVRSGEFALKTTTGVTTSHLFKYQFATGVNDFTGMNGYSNAVGHSLTNLGILNIPSAIGDGIWSGREVVMKFTGLDSQSLYSFEVYGYRNTVDRTTIYKMQGDWAEQSYEPNVASFASNEGMTLSFLNLRPDLNGEIALTLTPGTGGYAYLGAISMTSVVPEPSHSLLLGLGLFTVILRRSRARVLEPIL